MSLNRPDYAHLTDDEFAVLDERHSDAAAAREHMKAEAASIRYAHEVGGTTFSGFPVLTDRDAQSKIAAAAQAAALGMLPNGVRWKAADSSWRALTASDVQSLYAAVADHVQACYAREAAVGDDLDAMTDPEAILAYDLTAGWPE